jgi:hypothetical protein
MLRDHSGEELAMPVVAAGVIVDPIAVADIEAVLGSPPAG